MDEAALGPRAFAAHPLLMRQGGRHVVRAIQAVTAERGLSLMSSVETGTTMTLGRAENLTEGLEARMSALGPTALILGFDCVLRRIALEQAGLGAAVGRIYREHRVVGLQHLRRAARRAAREPDLRRPRLPRTGRAPCCGRLTTSRGGSRS